MNLLYVYNLLAKKNVYRGGELFSKTRNLKITPTFASTPIAIQCFLHAKFDESPKII